ncbi:AtpZ/AtpI family protein [Paenibacillus sp. GCM10027627]|uniref:AtpZ/AtpI family protein n=1 Tax=unclassified Paenibacillus TaxID=185978 RepID=UPI00362CFCC1
MNGKSREDNPWKAAALVGALGIDVGICVFLGYWLGSKAGESFGDPKAWTVGGLFVGLAVGILSAILIVRKVLKDSDG